MRKTMLAAARNRTTTTEISERAAPQHRLRQHQLVQMQQMGGAAVAVEGAVTPLQLRCESDNSCRTTTSILPIYRHSLAQTGAVATTHHSAFRPSKLQRDFCLTNKTSNSCNRAIGTHRSRRQPLFWWRTRRMGHRRRRSSTFCAQTFKATKAWRENGREHHRTIWLCSHFL